MAVVEHKNMKNEYRAASVIKSCANDLEINCTILANIKRG